MRVLLDPEQNTEQSGLIKSDPDVATSCAIAEPKISEEAARKKARRVENAIAIVSKDDYREARFGRIPGNSARILWLPDGSMYTLMGIPYTPEENERDLPFDMPKLEPFEKEVIPEHHQ